MAQGVHGWRIVRGSIREACEPVLADPASAMTSAGAVRFREGKTRVTALLPATGALWKWYRRIGSRAKLRALGGPSDVAREFDLASEALKRGLLTPEPLFAAERRVLGLLTGQLIAFHYVADSASLDCVMDLRAQDREGALSPQNRLEAMRLCGGIAAACHRAGVKHNDLRLDNVLLERTGGGLRAWLIDWNRALFPVKLEDAQRLGDVAGVVSSLLAVGATMREWQTFFGTYCREMGWAPGRARRGKRRMLQMVRRRLCRLVERGRRNALRKSRRLVVVRARRWLLACVRRVQPEQLAATIEAAAGCGLDLGRGAPSMAGVEVMADPAVADTWRAASVAASFRLPCSDVLGVVVDSASGGGWLVTGPVPGRPIGEELRRPESRAGALNDVRSLAHVMHASGLRFRTCAEDDLRRPEGCPALARRAGGLIVANPSVLRVQPEADTGASWEALCAYLVAAGCEPGEAATIRPRVLVRRGTNGSRSTQPQAER